MPLRRYAALSSCILLILGFLLAGASTAAGQAAGTSSGGTIWGKVVDQTGAVLPGVTVTVAGPSLMGVQETVTNPQGIYRFPSLPPGVFSLTFSMPEFNTLAREGITLKAAVPELDGQIILNCRYSTAVSYKETAFGFDLSDGGAAKLATQVPLSRYIGLIEITSPDRPLFDVILDATETSANQSVLACVRRPGMASTASECLQVLAKKLGAVLIS